MRKFLSCVSLVVLLFQACKKQQLSVGEILEKSIEFHGGIQAMEAVQEMQFKKTVVSYDSVGAKRSTLRQEFYFNFKTEQRALSWQEGTDLWELLKENDSWQLLKNSEPVGIKSTQLDSFEASLNGGLYVYWQPYKLYKDLAEMAYLGTQELMGHMVHVVEVRYSDSEDIWQYYFSTKSYRLMANRVLHQGRYSLITNNSIEEKSGFSLAASRTSYRVSAQNELLWKQADYTYELMY
jgi:hypothetical protein